MVYDLFLELTLKRVSYADFFHPSLFLNVIFIRPK